MIMKLTNKRSYSNKTFVRWNLVYTFISVVDCYIVSICVYIVINRIDLFEPH